ncbi:MAG: CHAP domain-containing protein [Candidatus Saccharibacteria bacterium]|nr:CHAP domain-containing protein [Candidatus Saccharibacteria bacterium]
MKTKTLQKSVLGIATVLLAVPFLSLNVGQASALSRACQSSPECVAAAAKEAEANKAAAQATSSANAYQIKVSETAAQIASKEAEIAETKADVEALEAKIEKNTAKIADEREALADLLHNEHFKSNAEPIKILAGSVSISDLAEKAAREQVAREQINAQSNKIKKTKAALESDKAKVESKLSQQKQAKEELVAKRQEREQLVAKYQNDADAYEAVAKAAREEKQAAERAWQETHRDSLGGLAYYSGDNTYPWQGDCPGSQDYYMTYIDGRAVGGYVCECVSYAGWKAYEYYGVYLAWGHAYSWDDYARAAGYRVDNSPAAGTVGQVDGYPYGHVFWVESVNGDGSINVTEYNNAEATRLYSGSFHYGDFGARTIPAGEVGQYNYIHF